jgi:hypothetical protein
VVEHRAEHGSPALVGERGVGVAQHRRRPAAQGRRVDRQGRPGRAAEVHQASTLGEHQRRGRARDAGQRVDDDVGGTLARLAQPRGQGGGVVVGPQLDHGIRTAFGGALQGAGRARRRHDAAGTEQPRRLDGDLADDPSGAEHQHGLARAHRGTAVEHLPGGDGREAQGGHHGVGEVGVDQDGLGGVGHRELGQPAVTGRHPGRRGEPHPPADELHRTGAHDTDRLHARYVRQCGRAEVRGA